MPLSPALTRGFTSVPAWRCAFLSMSPGRSVDNSGRLERSGDKPTDIDLIAFRGREPAEGDMR